MTTEQIQEILRPLIDWKREGYDEPLDGDEVGELVEVIRDAINQHEGNV